MRDETITSDDIENNELGFGLDYLDMCLAVPKFRRMKVEQGCFIAVKWGEAEDDYPTTKEGIAKVAKEMADSEWKERQTYPKSFEDDDPNITYDELYVKWIDYYTNHKDEDWSWEIYTDCYDSAPEARGEYCNHSKGCIVPTASWYYKVLGKPKAGILARELMNYVRDSLEVALLKIYMKKKHKSFWDYQKERWVMKGAGCG